MTGNAAASAPFIGAWTLLSYELTWASGAVEKPLGERPAGRLLYLENGQMSAQVMTPGLDPMAHEDPTEASAEEAARAWRNYVGYWGAFTVDAEAGVVIHDVEGSWFPNWTGRKQVRRYGFAGDVLTLEADAPGWHAKLVWRRL